MSGVCLCDDDVVMSASNRTTESKSVYLDSVARAVGFHLFVFSFSFAKKIIIIFG